MEENLAEGKRAEHKELTYKDSNFKILINDMFF
jgi:hypothetical protein